MGVIYEFNNYFLIYDIIIMNYISYKILYQKIK